MTSVSVVVPVKDGARYLPQLIDAVRAAGDVELLVIDSGSHDGSVELARSAGATVHEIPPDEFGHGRTRNLGMELTSGEVVCFLTQDAVPTAGWLDAHLEALELGERVGASYGPHLPWPDTSPMIARELEQFFATMSADGGPTLQRSGDLTFLSNVNAAYRRACWAEIRFDDVAYAEDQAFGRAMLAAGWTKAYHPRAAVTHAHDYGPVEFAQRYFDEYRGLRETIGHIEPARPGRALRDVRAGVVADRRWMAEQRWPGGRRAAWTARSLLHHGSRKAAAIAATRPGRLPAALERRLSLEGRASTVESAAAASSADAPVASARGALAVPRYAAILRYAQHGPVALAPREPEVAERDRLHLAFLIPPFRRGSGGHSSIFQLILRLERMGHDCTVWVLDPSGNAHVDRAGVIRRNIVDWFAPIAAPVFTDLAAWHGADVCVATGWDTAHQVAVLPGCGARAYLIHDHEPEFFATSAERLWAEQTYSLGLYPISGSDWLRDLVAERYGTPGTSFRFGVDHDTYRVLPVQRRQDTVLFYSRAATPRRAVPLGVLALEELCARRPDTRIVGFGQTDTLKAAGFASESLGVASPARLAEAYAEATVGLCLSLTNYSLIPQEMMACGLPCVDVAGLSSEAVFGADGPVELADADPVALADAIERLLDGGDRWRHRSEAGLAFVADASWDTAAEQVEQGLREALRTAAAHAAQP